MTIESRAPERGAGSHRLAAALLLAGAAAALLLRGVSIAEPLGIDQSLWASAVRGMSRGQLLYRDVWEQRPPGIYWIYLAGFNLFGWKAATVAWLDILAATANTVLLFLIVRRLSCSVAGALAAALYAILTMPAWLYGNGGFLERSVCETFIAAAVAAAAWCAVRFRERPNLAAAGVGLWCGVAIVLKPNAGLYLPALLLWMLVYGAHDARTPARALRTIVTGGLTAAIVPIAALVWLWRLDLLHDAKVAVVDFNRFYVAQGFSLGSYAWLLSHELWRRIKTDPLWLAGAAGVLAALWTLAKTRRLPPAAGLGVAWGAAAAIVIVVNGARLYNSYFIQTFPPLALLGAWMLAEWPGGVRARRALATVTVVLMLALLISRGYPARVLTWARADFGALTGHLDRNAYLDRFGAYGNGRGYAARANEELSDYVRAHTAPDEQVFLFGINGAGVYFAADRLTAHRFFRANFFVETDFPDPQFRLDAVTADLAARRPRYLIFEQLHTPSAMGRAVDGLPDAPPVAALLRGYHREAVIEDFTLYRRAD